MITVGQNPYKSRVTDRTEYAPIVASLTGLRGMSLSRTIYSIAMLTDMTGSDISLLRIAERALKESGWPVEVLTGRHSFLVGDNDRHVDYNRSQG